MNTETIFLTLVLIAAVIFFVWQRYSLRDYNIRTEGLPDGVLIKSVCKGTRLYHVLSDGEGFSRVELKDKHSASCGHKYP